MYNVKTSNIYYSIGWERNAYFKHWGLSTLGEIIYYKKDILKVLWLDNIDTINFFNLNNLVMFSWFFSFLESGYKNYVIINKYKYCWYLHFRWTPVITASFLSTFSKTYPTTPVSSTSEFDQSLYNYVYYTLKVIKHMFLSSSNLLPLLCNF